MRAFVPMWHHRICTYRRHLPRKQKFIASNFTGCLAPFPPSTLSKAPQALLAMDRFADTTFICEPSNWRKVPEYPTIANLLPGTSDDQSSALAFPLYAHKDRLHYWSRDFQLRLLCFLVRLRSIGPHCFRWTPNSRCRR